jgi:membrane-associated HD superfamily phosphohydrolase
MADYTPVLHYPDILRAYPCVLAASVPRFPATSFLPANEKPLAHPSFLSLSAFSSLLRWNLALFLLYLALFVACIVLVRLNRNEYVVKVRFYNMLVTSAVGGLVLTLTTCVLIPEDNFIVKRISYSVGIAAYLLFLCPYLGEFLFVFFFPFLLLAGVFFFFPFFFWQA